MPSAELVHLAGVLISACTLIGGIIWWLVKRHINKLQRENRVLKEKNTKLKERNADLEQRALISGKLQTEVAELKATNVALAKKVLAFSQRLKRAQEQAAQLEQLLNERVETHTKEVETREEQIHRLETERDHQSKRATEAEAHFGQLTAQHDHLNKQLEQVIKQDERVWERPVTGPAFVPLIRRDVPIIAVLNLKGGVGKTTITANLAGLMAQQGKRVLVIDADYQRNLSMLLKSDKDRKMLHLEGKTLQHFLKNPSNSLQSLLLTASEVSGLTDCRIVTNSDALNAPSVNGAPTLENISLEDIEMRLMAGWMFRQTGADIRLQLRAALHDQSLKEKGYRYVLIDCPPRLSTACINALAACDFFLVPVLLDATSARSVPNLLRTLMRLRTPAIFPHLKCLGIVANGVTFWKEKPIARELKTWQELPTVCRVAWNSSVHLFHEMVPHSGALRRQPGRWSDKATAPVWHWRMPRSNKFSHPCSRKSTRGSTMKVSTLQLFLRSLRPALTAAGGNPSLPADLDTVAAGLEPFAALDFNHFAAFLRQAEQYRSTGAVSVPTPASLATEKVQTTLRGAAALTDKFACVDRIDEKQLKAEWEKARRELKEEFAAFLKPLAITVTFKEEKNGFDETLKRAKTKAIVARVRAVLDGVTDQVSLNDPQRQQRLHAVVDQLPLPDLKAVAIELDTQAKGTKEVLLSGIVERITGQKPVLTKATPKGKQAAIDQAVVQQQAVKLKGLLEKSMDPGGLSSTELEATISELELRSLPELKAIAKELGLEEIGKTKKAILSQTREKLRAAERAQESIQV